MPFPLATVGQWGAAVVAGWAGRCPACPACPPCGSVNVTCGSCPAAPAVTCPAVPDLRPCPELSCPAAPPAASDWALWLVLGWALGVLTAAVVLAACAPVAALLRGLAPRAPEPPAPDPAEGRSGWPRAIRG